MSRLFRMSFDNSVVTLFDANFAVGFTDWSKIDHLFSQRYDSARKEEEVPDDLASVKLEEYKRETEDDKNALRKVVDRIAKLYSLSIPSDKNEAM